MARKLRPTKRRRRRLPPGLGSLRVPFPRRRSRQQAPPEDYGTVLADMNEAIQRLGDRVGR